LLSPGERGETKLSKARWRETERAKDRTINRTKKEGDFSPLFLIIHPSSERQTVKANFKKRIVRVNFLEHVPVVVPPVTGGIHCYRKIDEDFLESILLENIGQIFDTSISEQTREVNVNIEKEIKRIDSKIEKVLDLDIETLLKDKIRKKIEQLQKEKIELLHRQKKTVQSQNVTQYFKQVEEIYPYTNREERKRLWNIVIQRIAIYDDYVEIDWNNGKKTRHKKVLKANSVSKVREGGVAHFTHSIFEGLEKEFN